MKNGCEKRGKLVLKWVILLEIFENLMEMFSNEVEGIQDDFKVMIVRDSGEVKLLRWVLS